jgi:hypothetical protein
MKPVIQDILRVRLNPDAREWFDAAIAAIAETSSDRLQNQLLKSYSGMTRRLGKEPIALTSEEQGNLASLDTDISLINWCADEVGRAVLMLALAEHVTDPSQLEGLALDCYWNGDSREQQSWLRALPLLPEPERYVNTATDACRTNIIPLFEAIACENPFPARLFPELHFNQMVLKALFNVIALNRIVGLEHRVNPEMSRMANDYVSEREAAGRSLPPDIWLAVVPFADREGLERATRYVSHEEAGHRHWATEALERRKNQPEGIPS